MKISWLSQGSFLFDINGVRILVDPYMSDCLDDKGFKRLIPFPLSLNELKPDLLVCTHDHLDHLDPETVKNIAETYPECIISGPESCYEHFRSLDLKENQIKQLNVGSKISLPGVTLNAVIAYHTELKAIGIILETEGKKLYLSGDTIYDRGLINDCTKDSDIIIICINGRLGNMRWEDALSLVTELRPETALPMHYGLFAENTADPSHFINGCKDAGIKSFAMEVGKTFEF